MLNHYILWCILSAFVCFESTYAQVRCFKSTENEGEFEESTEPGVPSCYFSASFTFSKGKANFIAPLKLGEHAETGNYCAFIKDGRELKMGDLKDEAFANPRMTFTVRCYCTTHGCNGNHLTIEDQVNSVKKFLECQVLEKMLSVMREGILRGPSIEQMKKFFDGMSLPPPPLPNWPEATPAGIVGVTKPAMKPDEEEIDFTMVAIIAASSVVVVAIIMIPVIRMILKRRRKAWLAKTWDKRLKQAEDDLLSKQTGWFKPKTAIAPTKMTTTSSTSSATSTASTTKGGTTTKRGTTAGTTKRTKTAGPSTTRSKAKGSGAQDEVTSTVLDLIRAVVLATESPTAISESDRDAE